MHGRDNIPSFNLKNSLVNNEFLINIPAYLCKNISSSELIIKTNPTPRSSKAI
jgi:hypothetical protein